MHPRSLLSQRIHEELAAREKAFSAEELEDLPELVRLAARLEPKLRKQFLDAVELVKGQVNLEALAIAILSRNLTAIELASKVDSFLDVQPAIKSTMMEGFLRGARYSLDQLDEVALVMNLNLVNPEAVRWAESAAGELVTNLIKGEKESIQALIVDATKGNADVRQTAKQLRDFIGLDKRREKAVLKYEQELIAEGLDQATIDKRLAKYTAAQLKDRSLSIARTEIVQAHNMGQQALWDEAIKNGFINPQAMQKKWIVTDDDKLDKKICLPLDDVVVEIQEPFQATNGQHMTPPAHPRCRCAVGLVERNANE